MATIGFRFLSWNLDSFGKYNYSGTMSQIAQAIIGNGAELAVILEVFAKGKAGATTKKVKVGDDLATAAAKVAVDHLLNELVSRDAASNWKKIISGVSAGSEKKDAYAFYWKSTPQGIAPPNYVLPTSIKLLEGPIILTTDSDGKILKFGGSRRPAACKFEMTNGADTKLVWVCGFHASAEFSHTDNDIKVNIIDGMIAANAVSAAVAPIVLGCDLNLNYKTYSNFYTSLKTTYGFTTALTGGVGTSLLSNPDFDVDAPVLAKNAFDNFLFKNLNLLPTLPWKTEVIDVVRMIANTLPPFDARNRKRSRAELDEEAYSQFKTKAISTTSSISDHFPIIGAFGF